MAIKTGTITARPTNAVAYYEVYYRDTIEGFLAGTSDLECTSTSARTAVLNGFDFSNLSTLKNVTVTGITVKVVYKGYKSSAYYTRLFVNLGTELTQGSSSYTDLGDGQQTVVSTSETPSINSYATKTITDLPNSLAWINNNLADFINDPYSFGIRLSTSYMYINELTVSIEYTYEEEDKGRISTAVLPEGTGSVTGGGTYEHGATATLTAIPNDGYVFKQWSDGNTDNPRTVTVTGDVTYTAEFESAMPEFTLVQMLYNNKQISKDNKVPAGQSFRLIAGVK